MWVILTFRITTKYGGIRWYDLMRLPQKKKLRNVPTRTRSITHQTTAIVLHDFKRSTQRLVYS